MESIEEPIKNSQYSFFSVQVNVTKDAAVLIFSFSSKIYSSKEYESFAFKYYHAGSRLHILHNGVKYNDLHSLEGVTNNIEIIYGYNPIKDIESFYNTVNTLHKSINYGIELRYR